MPRSAPRRRRSEVPLGLVDLDDVAEVVTLRRTRGLSLAPRTAIAQFVESRLTAGRTERTSTNYAGVLGRFATFLEEQREISDIWQVTRDDMEGWLARLRTMPSETTGKRRSAYTVSNYARHLLACWHWLEERGLAPPHTTHGVHAPAIPPNERKQPRTFTDANIETLFAACTSDGQGEGERLALTQRNRAMVAVLLDTGVRVSELCSMRVEGITWEQQSLRVLASKTQVRTVGFGAQNTAKDLRLYLQRARPYFVSFSVASEVRAEEGPLWLTRDGDPMTPVGVRSFFQRLERRIGIAIMHPHTCRRYYITRALQGGVAPAEVARQCGVSIEVIMRQY